MAPPNAMELFLENSDPCTTRDTPPLARIAPPLALLPLATLSNKAVLINTSSPPLTVIAGPSPPTQSLIVTPWIVDVSPIANE